MAGNSAGAKKSVAVIKAKYGDDFYKVLGAKGGKAGNTGGFYQQRELASKAGAVGGLISRRSRNNQPLELDPKQLNRARRNLDKALGRAVEPWYKRRVGA